MTYFGKKSNLLQKPKEEEGENQREKPEDQKNSNEKEQEQESLWRIPDWFPNLGEEKLERLHILSIELLNFNSRLNLVSSRTEKEVDRIHFADSIVGGQMILEYTKKEEIYCFGSGNGFPGLVMACLDPKRKFFLIDSDARKINFLKYVVGRMRINNCNPIHQRMEDVLHNSVDCVVSRALGNISQCLLKSYKACKLGTEYFHFKGSSWMKEVSDIPIQICSLWSPQLIGEYQLPDTEHHFAIVLTERNDSDD